jgi:hypothetical protein
MCDFQKPRNTCKRSPSLHTHAGSECSAAFVRVPRSGMYSPLTQSSTAARTRAALFRFGVRPQSFIRWFLSSFLFRRQRDKCTPFYLRAFDYMVFPKPCYNLTVPDPGVCFWEGMVSCVCMETAVVFVLAL